jgi:hypothetical protein
MAKSKQRTAAAASTLTRRGGAVRGHPQPAKWARRFWSTATGRRDATGPTRSRTWSARPRVGPHDGRAVGTTVDLATLLCGSWWSGAEVARWSPPTGPGYDHDEVDFQSEHSDILRASLAPTHVAALDQAPALCGHGSPTGGKSFSVRQGIAATPSVTARGLTVARGVVPEEGGTPAAMPQRGRNLPGLHTPTSARHELLRITETRMDAFPWPSWIARTGRSPREELLTFYNGSDSRGCDTRWRASTACRLYGAFVTEQCWRP